MNHERDDSADGKGLTEHNSILLNFLRLGLVTSDELVKSYQLIYSEHGSEAYIFGYRLTTEDLVGITKIKLVKEASIISGFSNIDTAAKKMLARASFLKSIGISTIEIFGVFEGTIFSTFIEDEDARDTYKLISHRDLLDPSTIRSLKQLIDIAYRLDRAGFVALDFLADLLHDKQTEMFYYSDFGSDLGDPCSIPCFRSRDVLIAKFPRHADYIRSNYQELESDCGVKDKLLGHED